MAGERFSERSRSFTNPPVKGVNGEHSRASRRMLSTREAAAYLGLAPRTLWNGSGRKAANPFPIKPKRWGKKLLWDIRDLDKFADGLPIG